MKKLVLGSFFLLTVIGCRGAIEADPSFVKEATGADSDSVKLVEKCEPDRFNPSARHLTVQKVEVYKSGSEYYGNIFTLDSRLKTVCKNVDADFEIAGAGGASRTLYSCDAIEKGTIKIQKFDVTLNMFFSGSHRNYARGADLRTDRENLDLSTLSCKRID